MKWKSDMTKFNSFRYDINGLRAIAIIAVVLFHFNPSWVPGGFAGVDVFFVISGFLMTGIIFRGIETDNFSIWKFYVARANRIVPALAIICLVLLALGWFYLTPLDYRTLGKHVGSSMLFLSNFIYWLESGYFDAASYEKWLLHTWSLSVEWQFYIIYPLLLVGLRKCLSVNAMKKCILIAAMLGFILCIILTYQSPNQAYYLLPARAWEMMMGGVAFLYPFSLKEQNKKYLEWFGLLLVIGSYLLISKNTPWPGYLSIFPVLGAFFIIQSQRNNSIVTNNLLFQKLGTWSYSIYLYHWPLVVAIYYFSLDSSFIYLGIVASIFLGFISNKYVENIKFKSNFSTVFTYVKCKPLHLIFLTTFLGSFVFISNGVNKPFRAISTSAETLYMAEYHRDNYIKNFMKSYNQECNFFDTTLRKAKKEISETCINKGEGGMFIWGDSHAQALSYGIRKVFVDENITQITTSNCRPLVKESLDLEANYRPACDRANANAKEEILKVRPKVIILVQRIDHHKNDYNEIISYLKKHNINSKLILIGPVPQWEPSLPNAIAKRHFDKSKLRIDDKSFVASLFQINHQLHGTYGNSEIKYISLLDELCNEKGCLAKVDNMNTPLVYDYGHLSLAGSKYVAEKILKEKIKPYL